MSYSSTHARPFVTVPVVRSGVFVSAPRRVRGAGDVRVNPAYQLKAELFRTLGHPVRVRMLELIGTRERTVGELQDALELDASSVSRHLAALRRQGLLESRKVATSVHCRVTDRRTLRLLTLAQEILATNVEERRELLGELGVHDGRRAPRRRPA